MYMMQACKNHIVNILILLVILCAVSQISAQQDLHKLVTDGNKALELGEFSRAENIFQTILQTDGSFVPALKGLGEVKIRKKMLVDALEIYKKIVSINSSDLHSRIRLADIYSWMGDYDYAITTYRDILSLDPLNLETLNGLARVFRWAMRYDDAKLTYNKVLQIEPKNDQALRGMAHIFALEGNFKSALETIEKAIQYSPQNSMNLLEKGNIQAWNNRYDDAEQSFNEALKIDSKSADIYESLGDLFKWQKKYKSAINSYQDALKINPKNVSILLQLARVYKDLNLHEKAKEMVQKAFQIQPDIAEGFEILRELEHANDMDLVKILDYVVEPMILLGIIIMLALYFHRRSKVTKRKIKEYKILSSHILPSVTGIWVILILLNYFIEFSNFPLFKEVVELVTLIILTIALISFRSLTRAVDNRQKKVVLAIGAHPDDIELGCGGTLAKFVESGYDVHGLVASVGENGNPSKKINRKTEAEKAARVLGLKSVEVLNFKDTEFKNQLNEIKLEIEKAITKTNAQLVITQSPHDIHQDHRTIFEATKIAARNVGTILCFEDVSTEPHFDANYFIDITDYLDDKLKAISLHRTQKAKSYMQPNKIRGRALHRGMQSGVQFAEAFLLYKGLDL